MLAPEADALLAGLEAMARDNPFRFLRPEPGETLKAIRDRAPEARVRAERLLARRGVLLGQAVAEGWTPPPRP